MIKYQLLIKDEDKLPNHKMTCACGKCPEVVTIDEESKEEFKRMLGWDESKFCKLTKKIEDAECTTSEAEDKTK